jgi:hypothetical protein
MKFCPKCWSPSDGCCNACGWFCDETELLDTPGDGFNLTRSVIQVLAGFRDISRSELLMEGLVNAGDASLADLRKVRLEARDAAHSIIGMFVKTAPKRVLKRGTSGIVPWPADWNDRHYNACNEPCDMLCGPCSCGAWHCEGEEWVQVVLKKHNAVIE